MTAVNVVDQSQELGAPLDDATVVERDVVPGVLLADLRQARLEVLEVAPDVAVVRAEAGQVDVGEEEHLAVDTEAAVATRVPGKVHGLDGRATEVEDVAVAEPGGVGARGVVEHLDDVLGKGMVERESVHRHQPVEAVDARQVVVVHEHTGIGEQAVAGHVVLVAVAVDDGVHGSRCAAALDDGDGRVDDEGLGPDRARAASCRTDRRRWHHRRARSPTRSADVRRHPSRWSPRGRYLPSRHLVDVSPGRQMAAPIGRTVPRESRRGRLRQRREPS